MILTKTVAYRGREIPISMMKPNSDKKILVKCPDCGDVRETWLKVIKKSDNYLCHKCTLHKLFSKTLEIDTVYGKLTVISHSKKTGYSVCKCECGNTAEIDNTSLKSGDTNSCGCLKKENFRNVNHHSGEKHWNWKGGISSERQLFMAKGIYKEWRESIYGRDNFTCQKCGQKGYKLNAHHIKPFALNKSKRIDPDNGITLCQDCHNKFHSIFGRLNNTKQQIEIFLKGANNV